MQSVVRPNCYCIPPHCNLQCVSGDYILFMVYLALKCNISTYAISDHIRIAAEVLYQPILEIVGYNPFIGTILKVYYARLS